MSIWIEDKYINLLSPKLARFKRKDRNLYNFRCPICGDSERSKIKARGWIFEKGGKLRYYCHNCGASMLASSFIKTIDPVLYLDYQKDKFMEDGASIYVEPKRDITSVAPPKFISLNTQLKQLKKISSLPVDHPFKKYVMSRKIPGHQHYRLFYCDKFKSWVNTFLPGKFEDTSKDGPRLIIPFLDKEKKFFGCQGRSLSSNDIRYITILCDESKPRIFGLDSCNMSNQFYVLEGPIDSLFFDNAIAMCGSDLSSTLNCNLQNATVVFDNEPRSKQIVQKMSKYLDIGYKICFWPGHMKGKDVNEMVLNGHDVEEIKIIIDKNSFSGLEAKLQLQSWRKC